MWMSHGKVEWIGRAVLTFEISTADVDTGMIAKNADDRDRYKAIQVKSSEIAAVFRNGIASNWA